MTRIPGSIEILNDIRDIHGKKDGKCTECGNAYPCRTAKYVDEKLAARFDAAEPSGRRVERMIREEESFYSDDEYESYPED